MEDIEKRKVRDKKESNPGDEKVARDLRGKAAERFDHKNKEKGLPCGKANFYVWSLPAYNESFPNRLDEIVREKEEKDVEREEEGGARLPGFDVREDPEKTIGDSRCFLDRSFNPSRG
jgi:hypothetical protein